jgi:hypothetical protein
VKKNAIRSREINIVRPPAYPIAGPQLFKRMRAALTETFGAEPSFEDLGKLTTMPRSTTQSWFQIYDHPQIRFFLCLLEHLPQSKRMELLGEFCRDLQTLRHPRLAHDPIAVTTLENLLLEKQGYTLIRGGTSAQRLFLLNAMGHSFHRTNQPGINVAGLDVHEPKKFVPVPGVIYFKEPLAPAKLRDLVMQVWPEVCSSEARLLLFDGIWSAVPSLQNEISKLAVRKHVIVSEATGPDPKTLIFRDKFETRVVEVSHSKESPSWLQLHVATI